MRIHNCREDMLRDIVCELGWKMAEVGCFIGDFAAFLSTLEPAELHLIDPFEGMLCSGDKDGVNIRHCDGDSAYEYVCSRFRDDLRVRVHRTTSPGGLMWFGQGYFNVVYLDGDHTYEGVVRDLPAAFSRLRGGGWLTDHDYSVNPERCPFEYTFGVRRAVDAFCQTHGLTVSHVANDGYRSYAIQKPM
jgi:hypothetical protein